MFTFQNYLTRTKQLVQRASKWPRAPQRLVTQSMKHHKKQDKAQACLDRKSFKSDTHVDIWDTSINIYIP